jgi:hypothetical protein
VIPQRCIEPPEPRYREDDYWIDQAVDAYMDRLAEQDEDNEDEGDE